MIAINYLWRGGLTNNQYHWGWDWGPIVVASGPYMPIHIETYRSRIDDVHVTTDLNVNHSEASVAISIKAAGDKAKTAKVDFSDSSLQVVGSTNISLERSGCGDGKILLSNPKLWWPNGQGAQHLYTVSVSILDAVGNNLDEKKTKIGVRSIQLIQRPLRNAPGKTFMFNVNGRDIFSQGGNWIPADNLLPRLTRERYFEWIRLAKFNNLNMIRVWGGGIYETEAFFDACDEMGILVWHDFALACGEWPMNQLWLDNFKAEAEFQTRRLRNRASLALLCGGNEDFLLEDWLGDKYDFLDHDGPFEGQPFPQREIFLKLLREVCDRLAPTIEYWPSSPWGDAGENSLDLSFGDVHQWTVWHVDQHPYQKYKELSGRFVSEFGMHGFPIRRTIDVFAPWPGDRHPQSRAVDCHNKGHGAETRIARYLAENFRYSMEFDNFVYCSQLLQSEAHGYALRDWKRKFNPGNEECAGAIIWQLNYVYPVTSWSYVDYFLRPKPAFYTIRRNFAAISVGIERTPRSRFIDEDHQTASKIPTFAIFAHNTTPAEVHVTLTFTAYDLTTQAYIATSTTSTARPSYTLIPGHNTELTTLAPHPSWTEASQIVLQATLHDPSSASSPPLATFTDWPEPYRYLHWPRDTHVLISVAPSPSSSSSSSFGPSTTPSSASSPPPYETTITLTASRPVKGLFLCPAYDTTNPPPESEPEPLWSDNMLDLLPHAPVKVGVSGLRGRDVTARFLGDWEVDEPVRYGHDEAEAEGEVRSGGGSDGGKAVARL